MHHTLCLGPGFPRCLPRSGTPQALLYLRLGQQRSRRHCDGGQAALRVAKSMCVAGHSGVCCGAVAVRWGRWCVPRRARADWCYIWNARLFSAPPRLAGSPGGKADITVIYVCVVICSPCCTKVKQHGQDKKGNPGQRGFQSPSHQTTTEPAIRNSRARVIDDAGRRMLMGGEEHRQDPAPLDEPTALPVPRIRVRVPVPVPAGRRGQRVISTGRRLDQAALLSNKSRNEAGPRFCQKTVYYVREALNTSYVMIGTGKTEPVLSWGRQVPHSLLGCAGKITSPTDGNLICSADIRNPARMRDEDAGRGMRDAGRQCIPCTVSPSTLRSGHAAFSPSPQLPPPTTTPSRLQACCKCANAEPRSRAGDWGPNHQL